MLSCMFSFIYIDSYSYIGFIVMFLITLFCNHPSNNVISCLQALLVSLYTKRLVQVGTQLAFRPTDWYNLAITWHLGQFTSMVIDVNWISGQSGSSCYKLRQVLPSFCWMYILMPVSSG